MIGTTLSHFTITAKLGEGGMGEVYRAEDLELKREVALKLLPPAMAQDPQRLERFRREAEAVAALNHPNIVTLYAIESAEAAERNGAEAGGDVGEGLDPSREGARPSPTSIGALHFLVMELVEGESLDQALPPGGWPLAKVLDVALPIAEALATAHDKGIVHRDLKPANVMLTGDGRIKVLDFGLAKLAVESTQSPEAEATQMATLTEAGLVMGTAPYMSPEQAQGQVVDARSDIFSLGSILYEAATGVRAFPGKSTIDTLHKILHSEPDPLERRVPDAPLQLQWILRKALAKSPDDRYQSAQDLVVDLKSLRRDLDSDSSLPTVVSGRVPAAIAAAGKKRSPVLWGAIAVAALLGVALLFWTLGRQTAAPVDEAVAPAAVTKRAITASGLVTSAAISPDGKYVVFVESLQGEQSLNLRQVEGAQSLQLIEFRPVAYWGLSFNPESTAVVFGVKSDENPTGSMYQMSTLGGSAKKLVTRLDSSPTFSPDGAQMSWVVAGHPEQNLSSIMVANSDGGEPRVLATYEFPDLVAPIFHTAPSWSPDGRLIATSILNAEGQRRARLIAVDAETGEVEWTAQQEWQWSAMVGWLPGGDGLLAIAETAGNTDAQIWYVPYPEGKARQLTSDLFDYRVISLTADGKALVTIPATARSDMWSLRLDGSQRPQKLSRSRLDGIYGFDFTPDGRIVYQTLEGGKLDLAVMSADGSDRQSLTDDEEGDRYVRVAPDGRIVVQTLTPSGFRIRRLDPDGGNSRYLTEGFQWGKPDISPDGKWVLYQALTEGIHKIWRVPLDGGTPELVIDRESFLPVVSPDNSRIAFYFFDPGDQPFNIGVAAFEGGEMELEMAAEPFYSGTLLRWSPDGKSLLTNTMPRDRANLWRLPLDGGEPERLTDFDERRMYWYGLAPDGETLIFTRGELSRDAVLIENFL
jgi:serine/threonine protein kinase/Tol biopolymer transport system component